jgi:aminoglycoside phosphotransferase (APT) family kinase protein
MPASRQLLADQFARLAELPVRVVEPTGTPNAIYRLGDDLYARLPRVRSWAKDLDKQSRWLPALAPKLSLPIPEPVGTGLPGTGYPFSWAIYRWIKGRPYAHEFVDGEDRAAEDLAQFVAELRRIAPVAGAPRGGRQLLRELDAATRTAIAAATDLVDSDAATADWDRARGYALHQAALIIPYYRQTNPEFAALAVRTVAEVLSDFTA